MRHVLRTMQRGAAMRWLASTALAAVLAAGGRCPGQVAPAEPSQQDDAPQAEQQPPDDQPNQQAGPEGRNQGIQRIQRAQRVQRSGAAQPAEDPFGQPLTEPAELDDELMALVSKLDHPDFETREQATEALFEARPTLSELQTLLAAGFLSPEQRNRLVLVARRKLLEEPRGALGIRMQPRVRNIDRPRLMEAQINRGIEPQPRLVMMEVMDLLPDLPARRVLKIGDRITHVDGETLTNSDSLIRYVQERRPGETVKLTVERLMRDENGNALRDADGSLRYEQLDIDLTLGSADKLINPDTGALDTRGPVYERRQEQAKLVAERFGVDSTRLDMAGPPKRTAPVAVAMANGPAYDGRVEQHKYIKELRRDIHLIKRGDVPLNQRMPIWQAQVEELQRQMNTRDLPPDEREFLQRVHERFMEILVTSNVLNQ